MRLYTEPRGNSLYIVERYIALAAFHARKVCAIHFDFEREILLTQSARNAESANIRSNNGA